MIPSEQIVPILGCHPNDRVTFLGTGSFIAPSGLLLTAEHVIRDWSGPMAVTVVSQIERRFPAFTVFSDRSRDLALLRVEDYAAPLPLVLATPEDIKPNVQVVSFEYGTTIVTGEYVTINPATRLGNVTRTLNLVDRFGAAGEDALELSFPALRGASGAPVMSNVGFQLWGVVIANVAYHLLPTQIERVTNDEGGVTEETRFMLPQALAVNIKHVHQLLAIAKVPGRRLTSA